MGMIERQIGPLVYPPPGRADLDAITEDTHPCECGRSPMLLQSDDETRRQRTRKRT